MRTPEVSFRSADCPAAPWSRVSLLMAAAAFLLMAAFLFPACSPASRDDARTVILWHSYTGRERAALEEAVRKFNSTNSDGIRVELLSVGFSNLPDKLVNSIPRGQGPDVFIFAHDRLGDWVDKKLLMPIDYWTSPGLLSTFIPSKTVTAFIKNGRLYALPMTAKTLVLFYRTLPDGRNPGTEIDALTSQGHWTMSAFLKMARQYTGRCRWNSDLRCYGLGIQVSSYHFAPFLHGFSGTFMDSRCHPTIVTHQALEAAGFFRDMLWSGSGSSVVPPELSYSLMAEMFNTGELAMVISGPWFMGSIKPGVKYGMVSLPSMAGRSARPFLTIEGIYMSSRARHPDAAFRVMKYLVSRDSALVRATRGGQPPVVRGIVEAVRDATMVSHYRVLQKAMEDAIPIPSCPQASVVWPPYTKALTAIAGRGASVRQALEEARWEIGKYLGACLSR